MNIINHYIYGGANNVNTIIGGVSASISTPALLATKLGISETMISRFDIVGSDVHARINTSYIATNNLFQLDTNIKSYYDFDGKMILHSTSSLNLFDRSTIENAYFPNWSRIPHAAFYNTPLKTLFTPLANKIEYRGLSTTSQLVGFTSGDILEVWGEALYNCPILINTEHLTLIRSAAFYGTKYINLNLPSVISFTEAGWFFNMTLCKTFNIPNIETMGQSANAFQNCSSAELISMRKLKVYGFYSGTVTSVQSGFSGLKLNCVIEVHINLATSDSGNPNPCLVWAKTNRSAIVKFYDDNGNYVSTL